MALAKLEGIVIRNVKFNDTDRILTVFTKQEGKASILAKRANTNPRFLAPTQLFAYSEFICYPGKKMYTLSSADYIKGFYKIQEDIERLGASGYICELIDNFYEDRLSEPLMFNLLLYTLNDLEGENIKIIPFIVLGFVLKMLGIYGMSPSLEGCMYCDDNKVKKEYYFVFAEGGTVCEKHKPLSGYHNKLTQTQLELLRRLLYMPLKEVKEIDYENYPEGICVYLLKVLDEYCKYNINKKTNSFDFLINLL